MVFLCFMAISINKLQSDWINSISEPLFIYGIYIDIHVAEDSEDSNRKVSRKSGAASWFSS